ncbi:MAG: putative 3-hydroxypropionyl-coenzyme A dehydratase [Promethearchaeota archaeon]|nr:MAG: putative 3-hydroxypropionyl-coenzyme A dehydratase [Candidatus Lokiarchaeota archaeon]
MNELVKYEKNGDIGEITLNKGENKNTLDLETLRAIISRFKESKANDDICVIYSAEGKHFTVGADLKYGYNLLTNPAKMDEAINFLESFQDLTRAMIDHPGIIIAGLHGWVIGGGFEELLCCDLRIAADDTRIMLPELGAGLFFSNASTKLLPRIIGEGRAKYLMLMGEEINAEQALEIGLVNKVCKRISLKRVLRKTANTIAQNSHLGVRLTKTLINENQDLSIEGALGRESMAMIQTGQSEEITQRLGKFVKGDH